LSVARELDRGDRSVTTRDATLMLRGDWEDPPASAAGRSF
jgi:hypothetical protein